MVVRWLVWGWGRMGGWCRGGGLLWRGSRWLLSKTQVRKKRELGRPNWLAGFGQGFDELVAEGGDVFGFAAGDEVAGLDYLFVDPVGAGVFEVGVGGGPGGYGLSFDDVCFDQAPGELWAVSLVVCRL